MDKFFRDATLLGVDNLFMASYTVIGQFRIISHYNAALFTARREEMCSIVELTFRYLVDRPMVHSDISGLPFLRALNHDMPHQDFFSLLRESNAEFLNRTGWFYTHSSPINMPPNVIVLPPI